MNFKYNNLKRSYKLECYAHNQNMNFSFAIIRNKIKILYIRYFTHIILKNGCLFFQCNYSLQLSSLVCSLQSSIILKT